MSEGVAQRIRALEAFLADVYDRGDIMRDGWSRSHWSPAQATITGRRTGSSPPMEFAFTLPVWTSSVTKKEHSTFSRTTCVAHLAFPTYWKTAVRWLTLHPRSSRGTGLPP